MNESDWSTEADPVAMLLWAGRRADHKRRQLFCLAVWTTVAHLLTDRWSVKALPALTAHPDVAWSDTGLDGHETLDAALTDLDSTLSNRFWDRLVAGDPELEDAWRSGTEARLTTWTDADSVRAGAAIVAVAAAEGWVRSLSGSGVVGVTPSQLALRAATNAAAAGPLSERAWRHAQRVHADVLRDILGSPFRSAVFDPTWRTATSVALALGMYESRDFGALPVLGDALRDAGCDDPAVLNHCRGPGPHVRGCWVVDLVLGNG